MKFVWNKNSGVPVRFVFEETAEKILLPELKERKVFSGKAGEVYGIFFGKEPIIYAGLGKEKDFTPLRLRDAAKKVSAAAQKEGLRSLDVEMVFVEGVCTRRTSRALVEGLLETEYAFDRYKKREKENSLETVNLRFPEEKEDSVSGAVEEAQFLMEAVFHTRDLVNTPNYDMHPKDVVEFAKKILEPHHVKITVFDREKCEELGMKAFLAVAQGSDHEPQFLIMEYEGNPESSHKVGLVGKGLCYDSGGYCIKPANHMNTMQSDMAGGATVIGAMEAIAKGKLKQNVVAVSALCENMISGHAYVTGDIVSSLSGKTIEVDNTDAEGRLTLADALYYTVKEYSPDVVVDLATLTGACVIALGDLAAGAITNNDSLYAQVRRASEIMNEPVWKLPAFEGYNAYIESEVADVFNSSKFFGGGAITAGLFLQNFVEDTPWVHLDIAGTAWIDRPIGSLPKRGTGSHVKTLYQFVKLIDFDKIVTE